MQNPRLAHRYAKSLMDLSIEKKQLEEVCNDMKYLQALCSQSREFTSLLKSPIIKADKKRNIINAVTEGKVSEITKLFNQLLVTKGRESSLAEIANAFIEEYNTLKGIHKVVLTTAVELSKDVLNTIGNKIKTERGIDNIELEAKVNKDIIGGFILEFDNNLVDASIVRDLRDVKKQFAKNIYIPEIR
ncbi:MAG TPA: ATP synthase F1 subunit delta [Chitinophagaceae bacterium]|nr:ATP synthase F1 subunit delta [Chitinophagaceae bacterium]MCC6634694.1 ATP synthase F1 subunit delta [Chitinophagaceae bacterium]HMZ46746.1 ATP synthase F1 subunit delta [Chitinophagaceae bacterium]HNE92794.1 ATP synthase F1 subunit delta [Chitinophagaceae bacterium]HNF30152.1 ATP synthase F1 subunit delta [Chitinophagaceae bacterium]